ncbi:class I SAM-dependent methyltransferase [Pedosphaera parvula]|nr:class I SAM-dependent methyltransferase [Pedosphaera parvula]
MILHKLVAHHLKHKDDAYFYLLQAQDAIRWLEQSGVALGKGTRVLDLGCGHGVFGSELVKKGCQVTFADEENYLLPELAGAPFRQINIDKEDVSKLGSYDLVICSNVLEHLAKPVDFINAVKNILTPSGVLYLSWTNWLSIWGGHEFSPFHYLGRNRGHLIYDKVVGGKRKHTPYVNLFPTYIGEILGIIRRNPNLRVVKIAPRYYTEFSFLMHIPVVREFLAWNCALLIGKK